MALSVASSNLPAAQQCCIASLCPVSLTLETSFPVQFPWHSLGWLLAVGAETSLSLFLCWSLGLRWWLSRKEPPCQCRSHGFDSWVGKIPWRRKWQPTPVFFLENPMDRRAWWARVHGVGKSQPRLSMYACLFLGMFHAPIPRLPLMTNPGFESCLSKNIFIFLTFD